MAPRRTSLQTKDNSMDDAKHATLRKSLILELAIKRMEKLNSCNDSNVRLPKGFYEQEVKKYNAMFDLNLDVNNIKHSVRRKLNSLMKDKSKMKLLGPNASPPPPDNSRIIAANLRTTTTSSRPKGGRPIGSTLATKEQASMLSTKAKNEITLLYVEEKRKREAGLTHLKYNDVVEHVKKKYKLPSSFSFSYQTARKRIYTNNLTTQHQVSRGEPSPLHELEPEFIKMFVILGNIGAPVSMGDALALINEMIIGTAAQQKLIQWKLKYKVNQDLDQLGQVSMRYVRGFMKRNSGEISSKKGRRFELNRMKWCTYSNFRHMYDNHEEAMIEAGVAVSLPVPVWMDEYGNEVSEDDKENAFGCKVRTELTRPDMCIVMDETGCNLSQKSDGNIGGKKFIVGKSNEVKIPTSTSDKHFTVIGLTLLTGAPLMCVIIIDAKRYNLLVELGVDVMCEEQLNLNENTAMSDFMKEVKRKKILPGGPSCDYKGKQVPCMTVFSEGGGMTGPLLTKIFKTLDTLTLFDDDRKAGFKPYVILDGHMSRFHLEFLQYINNPSHPWSVVIGVPYGTSLWQVGDSSEQNGAFKMELTKGKDELMKKKTK
jgi:hypothetical protein